MNLNEKYSFAEIFTGKSYAKGGTLNDLQLDASKYYPRPDRLYVVTGDALSMDDHIESYTEGEKVEGPIPSKEYWAANFEMQYHYYLIDNKLYAIGDMELKNHKGIVNSKLIIDALDIENNLKEVELTFYQDEDNDWDFSLEQVRVVGVNYLKNDYDDEAIDEINKADSNNTFSEYDYYKRKNPNFYGGMGIYSNVFPIKYNPKLQYEDYVINDFGSGDLTSGTYEELLKHITDKIVGGSKKPDKLYLYYKPMQKYKTEQGYYTYDSISTWDEVKKNKMLKDLQIGDFMEFTDINKENYIIKVVEFNPSIKYSDNNFYTLSYLKRMELLDKITKRKIREKIKKEELPYSAALTVEGYAHEVRSYDTLEEAKKGLEQLKNETDYSIVRGTQMWNKRIGVIEETDEDGDVIE